MRNKVLFDVDGVLLSEKRYFDVSSLVVWEWLYGREFMNLGDETVNPAPDDAQIDALRARFWKNDEILAWLKSHGVNSNWDMVHIHVVTTLWLMLERISAAHGVPKFQLKNMSDVRALGTFLAGCEVPDASKVLERLNRVVPAGAGKDTLFENLGSAVGKSLGDAKWALPDSALWKLLFEAFQAWYFGDELYEKTYGKKPYAGGKAGFLRREQPIGGAEKILEMFRELKRRGYEIGIATGRSREEVQIPFEHFGWMSEFDPLYVATFSDVQEAQNRLGLPLDKPNPFVYYVSAFGRVPSQYVDYVARPGKFKGGCYYYIVGDSLADAWCARVFGAFMIATLTGLDGKAARPAFEREGVDYIVDSVGEILNFLR